MLEMLWLKSDLHKMLISLLLELLLLRKFLQEKTMLKFKLSMNQLKNSLNLLKKKSQIQANLTWQLPESSFLVEEVSNQRKISQLFMILLQLLVMLQLEPQELLLTLDIVLMKCKSDRQEKLLHLNFILLVAFQELSNILLVWRIQKSLLQLTADLMNQFSKSQTMVWKLIFLKLFQNLQKKSENSDKHELKLLNT